MKSLLNILENRRNKFILFEDDETPEQDTSKPADSDDANKDDVIDMNGFVVLKPGFLDKEEDLRERLQDIDWEIVGDKTKQLTEEEAKDFYKEKDAEPYFDKLVEYMTSDKSKCFMCWKENSENPIEELNTLKEKLREEWEVDDLKNGIHTSDSFDAMENELDIFLKEEEDKEDGDKDKGSDEENDDDIDNEPDENDADNEPDSEPEPDENDADNEPDEGSSDDDPFAGLNL